MKKVIFNLIFLFATSLSFAGIYGAQIEWEQLSQDTFKVEAIFYTSCDTNLTLSKTQLTVASNCTTRVVYFNSLKSQDVTPVCKTQCSPCSSKSCAFKYGFVKHTFTTIIVTTYERSKSCCEITLALSEGKRQFTLTTGGANKNFYLNSYLNICQKDPLPKISWDNEPQFIVCVGRDVEYDYGMSAVNTKDSVVNSIYCPAISATQPLNWSGSYDCNKPLSYLGHPKTGLKFPRGYHVDSVTGTVRFRPMKIEATTTGIKTEIYRNGNLVAAGNREFPILVIKCPDNNPPVLSGINLSSPSPNNFKAKFCADSDHCITINGSDRDKNDTLFLQLLKSDLPNATISKDTSNLRSPLYKICFRADSTMIGNKFNFQVLLTDSACPVPATTIKTYSITIDTPDAPIMIGKTSQINCDSFSFSFKGNNDDNTLPVKWYINNKYAETNSYLAHRFQDTGMHIVKGMISTCGIRDSFIDTVYIKGLNTLNLSGFNDTSLCAETNLLLVPKVDGNAGKLSYEYKMRYFDKDGKSRTIISTDSILNEVLVYNNFVRFGISLELKDLTTGCFLVKDIAVEQIPSTTKNLGQDLYICPEEDSIIVFTNYLNHKGWIGDGLTNDTFDTKSLKRASEYTFKYEYRGESECVLAKRTITIFDHLNLFPLNTVTTCVGAQEIRLNPVLGLGTYSGNKIDTNVFTPSNANAGINILHYKVEYKGCNFFDSVLIDIKNYKPATGLNTSYNVCFSDSIFTVSPTTKTGKWSGPGYNSLKNELSIKPSDYMVGTFKFAYEITDSNQCKAHDTIDVKIRKGPKIIDYRIGRNNTVCHLDSFELYVAADSAVWEINNKMYYGSNTKGVYSGNAGTYFNVVLKAFDSLGCSTDSTIKVYNSHTPDAFFVTPYNVKKGDTIIPTNIKTTAQNHEYLWFIDKPINKTWNIFQPEIIFDTTGLFTLSLTVIDTNTQCFDVFRREFKVYKGTGIEENQSGLRVFPQPAKDFLIVESESEIVSAELYSITGKLWLTQNNHGNKLTINTKNLPKGTFIIQINTHTKTFIRKVIKE